MKDNFKIIWQGNISCTRNDATRESYRNTYWSANKVIFDPAIVPQTKQNPYDGEVAIVEVEKDIFLPNENINFGEVMEGLHIGINFPKLVKETQGGILFPGSVIKSPNGGYFVPWLFSFGGEVSLGIEALPINNGKPFISKGSKIFILVKE